MTKKATPTIALIAVPIVTGVISSWFRVTDTEAAPGVMNILPWGTPTIRAAAAMQMEVMELSQPVLIPVLCGLVCVIIFSIILGGKEKGRIGSVALSILVNCEDVHPEV